MVRHSPDEISTTRRPVPVRSWWCATRPMRSPPSMHPGAFFLATLKLYHRACRPACECGEAYAAAVRLISLESVTTIAARDYRGEGPTQLRKKNPDPRGSGRRRTSTRGTQSAEGTREATIDPRADQSWASCTCLMDARPVEDEYVFEVHIEVQREQRAQLAYLPGTLERPVQLHHPAPLASYPCGRRFCAAGKKVGVVLRSHVSSVGPLR